MSITPDRLSVNQFVVPGLTLDELCRECRDHRVAGVGVLRSTVEEMGPTAVSRTLSKYGIRPTSVCVIMGLVATDAGERRELLNQARWTLEAATELGVPAVVVVGGPKPGLPLQEATSQAVDAIAALAARAEELGGRILLEPLHPMMAGLSAFTSLRQAIDLASGLRATGVVLDTWHVWNEFDLNATVARHGSAIDIVHVSDWAAGTTPTTDREFPGSGVADLAGLCSRIDSVAGDRRLWWEIEVLSERLSRRYSQIELLDLCIHRTKAFFWPQVAQKAATAGKDM
jgi:sugar phosphate isomerase/epimerase